MRGDIYFVHGSFSLHSFSLGHHDLTMTVTGAWIPLFLALRFRQLVVVALKQVLMSNIAKLVLTAPNPAIAKS